MKAAFVLLSTLALAFAAPQSRHKDVYDHLEDFFDVISEEVGHELEHIVMDHYMENEEFQATLNFMLTDEFKNLLRDVRDLPEAQAVMEFLRSANIEFTDFFGLDDNLKSLSARHDTTGKDFTSYFKDFISLLPHEKLADLYHKKMAEDEEFKSTMESLLSDEFCMMVKNLWTHEVTQKLLDALAQNGWDVNEDFKYTMEYYGVNL